MKFGYRGYMCGNQQYARNSLTSVTQSTCLTSHKYLYTAFFELPCMGRIATQWYVVIKFFANIWLVICHTYATELHDPKMRNKQFFQL